MIVPITAAAVISVSPVCGKPSPWWPFSVPFSLLFPWVSWLPWLWLPLPVATATLPLFWLLESLPFKPVWLLEALAPAFLLLELTLLDELTLLLEDLASAFLLEELTLLEDLTSAFLLLELTLLLEDLSSAFLLLELTLLL